MPRPSRGAEAFAGAGRIRKRGCSSSSSSSSVLQHCRLKRAVLVAKRGGASTPAPAWKIEVGSPSSGSEATRCRAVTASGSNRDKKQQQGGPVSARKLASALWELHGVPSPSAQGGRRRKEEEDAGRRDYAIPKLPSCLSDPPYSPCSQEAGRSVSGLHRRRGSPLVSQKSRLSINNNGSLDSLSNGSSMEIENRSRTVAPMVSVGKAQNRLKDLKNGLFASKELVKTVKRFLQIEEHHSSTIAPIIAALQAELERARLHVNHLTESSVDFDVGPLKQRLAEEKTVWKKKMQEKVQQAIWSVMEELELEKKLRRRADRLNEKLMMELTEAKAALVRASEEFQNERRQREVIEQVCDELVKGIGDDRAEMEKMKEESAKVREELEREREMLQLADIWREERVQMKLSEAKYHLEEKNAAVDQLRHELETYLANRRSKNASTGCGSVVKDNATTEEEGQECRDRDIGYLRIKKNVGEVEENSNLEIADSSSVDDDGELDSEDGDLHSIELSVDNVNKSYRWNFGLEKPTSRFPYEISTLECSDWTLQDPGDGLDFMGAGNTQEDSNKFHDQDVERYKSVKGLRDQMLSACKIAPARGLASPTRMWIQPRRSLDCGDHVLVGSKITKTGKPANGSESNDREQSCGAMPKTDYK